MDLNAAKINSTIVNQQVRIGKVLQEGSSVPVKVTRALGNGKYEGFVAGLKVSFSSERVLKAGSVFNATVSSNNGKILLTPHAENNSMLQNIQVQMNEMTSERVFSLLQSVGLSSDALSVSIFQMFTQSGLKIDAHMMNKIKSMALRFNGKEKSAAELLVMLTEKGISADEDEIKELLLQLAGELAWQNDFDKDDSHEKNQKKLIDRLNSKEGAWYLLPFELVKCDIDSVLGRGNIRLLFDSGKILKLLNLDCFYHEKRYLFSLSYENGKASSLHFNISDSENKENQIKEELQKRFLAADISGLNISFADKSLIEGNASSLENIYTFGGQA